MKKILSVLALTAIGHTAIAQTTELEPTEDSAKLTIIVTDIDKVPEQGADVLIYTKDSSVKIKGVTNADGKISALVPEGKNYMFIVNKFGRPFAFKDETVIPSEAGAFEMDVTLKIKLITYYMHSYKLENVYFDTDKAEIKAESVPSLQKLLAELVKNPKMEIEITGHTDNVGDDAHNMELSRKRANAIRDWLIKNNIKSRRLSAKGYGELKPVADNAAEAGRSKNRRTEVNVIKE